MSANISNEAINTSLPPSPTRQSSNQIPTTSQSPGPSVRAPRHNDLLVVIHSNFEDDMARPN